jgi:hypothetical protein
VSRYGTPAFGVDDPIVQRRVQIAKLVKLAKAIGYSLFLVAILAFVVTKIDRPTKLLTGIVAWTMAVGSLLLAPAIVFGYAVNAAEREDRAIKAVDKIAADAKHAQGTDHTEPPTT